MPPSTEVVGVTIYNIIDDEGFRLLLALLDSESASKSKVWRSGFSQAFLGSKGKSSLIAHDL